MRRQPRRSTVYALWLLMFIAVSSPFLHASPPGWWTSRGVLDATKQANDYAAVNQGQVKFIVEQASAELDADLPGGASYTTYLSLQDWENPSSATNDYAAVNLGMVKALAKPFYDQLIGVGYTDHYPWNADQSNVNNYAAANIGQVKNLFSFDFLAVTSANDSNNDGLPDWWENYYFGSLNVNPSALAPGGSGLTNLQCFQSGMNPYDYYDERLPMLRKVSGDLQTGGQNTILPQPIVVVATQASGAVKANVPVVFGPVTFGGSFSASADGSSPASQLTVYTDANGEAKAWFNTASIDLPQIYITVGVVGGDPSLQAWFREFIGTITTTQTNLPAPVANFIETWNADGSRDLTWTNVADDAACTKIRIRDQYGQWKIIGTVSPDQTSAHVNADGTLAQ